MPKDKSQTILNKQTVWLFLKTYIPVAIILTALVVAFSLDKIDQDKQRLLTDERNLIMLEKNVFETSLSAHINDAAFLATVVGTFLRQHPEDGFDSPEIKQTFLSFAKTSDLYSQHRILDHHGQEKLRINCAPVCADILPADQLQNKGKRDYYLYGISQIPGDVYVSRLDLNIEHGKVEKPFNPTMRLASAITGSGGKNAGVVVLNFKGKALLNRMRRMASHITGNLYFMDSDGHWIIGPNRDKEWGHSLPERVDEVFAKEFPEAWKTIERQSEGQFICEHGLFTFSKIDPHTTVNNPVRVNAAGAGGWILVGRVAPENLSPSWLNQAINSTVIFLFTLAVISWLWAAGKTRQKQATAALHRQEQLVAAIGKASHDAIAVVDSRDKVVFWNPSAEEMFGYSAEEAKQTKLHELIVPPDLHEDVKKGFAAFAATGHGDVFSQSREYAALRRDGTSVPVEIVAASMTYDGQWFAVGSMRDITRRKKAEQRLLELATTDSLTGIANRRHFTEQAQAEVNRSVRYGGVLSMIMFDVDHFKKVNDTYGHDAGDEVLKKLTQTAGQSIRDVDILGRLGGEEFAVLLPETGPDAALEVAGRLRAAVEAAVAETSAGPIRFTISLGVASAKGKSASVAGLLKAADNAMYQAKNDGRNLVRVS